jgi:hypothetical protein
MQEEIRCPECRSIDIEEVPYNAAVGPGEPQDELPKKVEYRNYKWLDCDLAFFETNLRK